MNKSDLRLVDDNFKALEGGGPPFDGPPGGGDNGGMETRVARLEDFAREASDRLVRIETKLDTFSTKSDLADAKADLVKWIVGTAIGLGVAAITVMTFVLNNATPKASTAQPPVIINIPSAAPAPLPAPSPQQ